MAAIFYMNPDRANEYHLIFLGVQMVTSLGGDVKQLALNHSSFLVN